MKSMYSSMVMLGLLVMPIWGMWPAPPVDDNSINIHDAHIAASHQVSPNNISFFASVSAITRSFSTLLAGGLHYVWPYAESFLDDQEENVPTNIVQTLNIQHQANVVCESNTLSTEQLEQYQSYLNSINVGLSHISVPSNITYSTFGQNESYGAYYSQQQVVGPASVAKTTTIQNNPAYSNPSIIISPPLLPVIQEKKNKKWQITKVVVSDMGSLTILCDPHKVEGPFFTKLTSSKYKYAFDDNKVLNLPGLRKLEVHDWGGVSVEGVGADTLGEACERNMCLKITHKSNNNININQNTPQKYLNTIEIESHSAGHCDARNVGAKTISASLGNFGNVHIQAGGDLYAKITKKGWLHYYGKYEDFSRVTLEGRSQDNIICSNSNTIV